MLFCSVLFLMSSFLCFQEAMRLLEKTLKMETKLVNDCKQKIDNIAMQQLPPPPVLIYRSATSMVFKPAPFVPLEKEEVYCYKFFLRNASGNNVKVRLSDGQVNGTGIEVICGPAIYLCFSTYELASCEFKHTHFGCTILCMFQGRTGTRFGSFITF